MADEPVLPALGAVADQMDQLPSLGAGEEDTTTPPRQKSATAPPQPPKKKGKERAHTIEQESTPVMGTSAPQYPLPSRSQHVMPVGHSFGPQVPSAAVFNEILSALQATKDDLAEVKNIVKDMQTGSWAAHDRIRKLEAIIVPKDGEDAITRMERTMKGISDDFRRLAGAPDVISAEISRLEKKITSGMDSGRSTTIHAPEPSAASQEMEKHFGPRRT